MRLRWLIAFAVLPLFAQTTSDRPTIRKPGRKRLRNCHCHGPDEFIGAGSGFRVHFKPATPGPARAGIGSVDEGAIRNGKWISGRRLNGDENDQGEYWRFDRAALRVERCVVYRWE